MNGREVWVLWSQQQHPPQLPRAPMRACIGEEVGMATGAQA